jgi:dolichol-phosphate mannosyltransferase
MATRIPTVSIVIPTLNEAGNIAPLIHRIDAALVNIGYEIIFVDDHSTDETVQMIDIAKKEQSLTRNITTYSKVGLQGKAFSLLEGFEKAKMDCICILDADLQYPPEAIPDMLEAILSGDDIVVANREIANTSLVRRSLSTVGRTVYGKWLYGLNCDVQSGLKLFRREVLNDLILNSTPWTFDLSFLVQSRERGHQIGSVPIPFSERHSGYSKVNIMLVGSEIVIEAIRFKLSRRKQIASYTDPYK